MEAGIFEHEYFARFEGFRHGFHFRSNAVWCHLDRDPQVPGQHFRSRFQAELGVRSAFWTAQVAHQEQRGTLFEHILDRRQCCLDAFVVGNNAFIHRDVEVHPHQHTLALQVNIFYGFFVHILHLHIRRIILAEGIK